MVARDMINGRDNCFKIRVPSKSFPFLPGTLSLPKLRPPARQLHVQANPFTLLHGNCGASIGGNAAQGTMSTSRGDHPALPAKGASHTQQVTHAASGVQDSITGHGTVQTAAGGDAPSSRRATGRSVESLTRALAPGTVMHTQSDAATKHLDPREALDAGDQITMQSESHSTMFTRPLNSAGVRNQQSPPVLPALRGVIPHRINADHTPEDPFTD